MKGENESESHIPPELVTHLIEAFGYDILQIKQNWKDVPINVHTVLGRQIRNTIQPDPLKPTSQMIDLLKFTLALRVLPFGDAILTLARLYEAGHQLVCKTLHMHITNGLGPKIHVATLAKELERDPTKASYDIEILSRDDSSLEAAWKKVPDMSFDNLPQLLTLKGRLPGERIDSDRYAGIGGGGGSDVVSASLLGRLLHNSGKRMDLLISTRTWNTGSQGKEGSKIGVKREIYRHGGQAMYNGRLVGGTYRVMSETNSEGRYLENIPLDSQNPQQLIWIVLDQSQAEDVPSSEQATLSEQYGGVLAQGEQKTVIVVDTGGDVFGSDENSQDLRAQRAMRKLKNYNLVIAVLAPGVDAPDDAPAKALQAGGQRYELSAEEQGEMLKTLVDDYRMDGSEPEIYSKTSLAFQERLRGHIGWVSLNLPEYVINTWKNPWNSFVYIFPCMSHIIFVPMLELLPLIDTVEGKTH